MERAVSHNSLPSRAVVRDKKTPSHSIITIMQLIGLLVFLSACGDIIRVVPADTPTPAIENSTASEDIVGQENIGIPSRIVAEAIQLDAPVIEMGWQMVQQGDQIISEWDMPDNEAAWHSNSALPGQGSNVIISGHNASTGGHVFAELDELQVGDEITLENTQAETLLYRVVEKTIVRSLAASEEGRQYLLDVSQPTPQEQLTLITCWPGWSNTHRLIVIAERVQNLPLTP
ncbi:MAG: sortase [Anaerolineae bacterium]|nr:sortase [Anaerolineae bacterium]